MVCRVLIVEDDPLLRKGMSMFLTRRGHEVLIAATVKQAVDCLGDGPSHILLDLNLPDGLGTTVLHRVREAKLPMKVAIISGTNDDALLTDVMQLLPDGMFKKPTDWEQVIAWIGAE